MSDAAIDETVLYECEDGVATLTLNRPERKNAWTIQMQRRYYGLLAQCDADPDVRAIIVTGSGTTFCPGADSNALQNYTKTGDFDPEAASIEQPDHYPWLVRKPMIAAINGACAGFGLVQTLMCDVRFAVPGARMTTAFARRGLPALHGIAYLLPHLIGYSRATELILSGRTFLTDEAAALGIVHQLHAADELLPAARAYATDLVANCSPESWRNMKEQLRAADHLTFEATVEDAATREKVALSSADFQEGVMSFVERRSPSFQPLR